MSVSRRIFAIVAAALFVCSKAYAPIFGTYPGLHSLIKKAEIIAAITIVEKLSEEDMGGSAHYKIQFEKVLKGAIPEKQAVADLRYLEITPEAEIAALFRSPKGSPTPSEPHGRYFGFVERFEPFVPSSRWIAFLAKSEQKDVAYENVNCAGSTFPLSPRTDLDALHIDSLPDTLIALYRDDIEFRRGELKEWEKQLDAFIDERDE
jgi:hypothetical protein